MCMHIKFVDCISYRRHVRCIPATVAGLQDGCWQAMQVSPLSADFWGKDWKEDPLLYCPAKSLRAVLVLPNCRTVKSS